VQVTRRNGTTLGKKLSSDVHSERTPESEHESDNFDWSVVCGNSRSNSNLDNLINLEKGI